MENILNSEPIEVPKLHVKDLTSLVLERAYKQLNQPIIDFLTNKDNNKESTVIEVVKDNWKTVIQCQYCQFVLKYKDRHEHLVIPSATDRIYNLLDALLLHKLVDGFLGFSLLDLMSCGTDPETGKEIICQKDGSQAVLGPTLQYPQEWRATSIMHRSIVLAYVFPSIEFIETLDKEQRTQKGIQEALNKYLFDGNNVFKVYKEGELGDNVVEIK